MGGCGDNHPIGGMPPPIIIDGGGGRGCCCITGGAVLPKASKFSRSAPGPPGLCGGAAGGALLAPWAGAGPASLKRLNGSASGGCAMPPLAPPPPLAEAGAARGCCGGCCCGGGAWLLLLLLRLWLRGRWCGGGGGRLGSGGGPRGGGRGHVHAEAGDLGEDGPVAAGHGCAVLGDIEPHHLRPLLAAVAAAAAAAIKALLEPEVVQARQGEVLRCVWILRVVEVGEAVEPGEG